MKPRKFLLANMILILAILACNLPGSTLEDAPPATDEAPVTVIVIENTATVPPTEVSEATSTPELPSEITLTKNSNCRLGPSTFYNIADQIASGQVLPVYGQNEDGTWWLVANANGRECWVYYDNAQSNVDFSGLPIKNGPPLPGIPGQFYVTDQLCQPGPKKFTVTLSWSIGSDTDGFRLYRDGKQIIDLKITKFNYKDTNAPYNKNITYELEAL
ncbi:MAG: SH3 domain-containing protein [Anaerolineales bacterium]|nr:SH3 domain-containing protein [Anaerolineales bacterium]